MPFIGAGQARGFLRNPPAVPPVIIEERRLQQTGNETLMKRGHPYWGNVNDRKGHL
jgi:hypothetical protein